MSVFFLSNLVTNLACYFLSRNVEVSGYFSKLLSIWTAVEETNMGAILPVLNTT